MFRLYFPAGRDYPGGMKRLRSTGGGLVRVSLVWLVAMVTCGCASNKALWNRRLGTYSYDQAILEYGPPDRSAKLEDGTKIADWLTRRGYPGGYSGFGYYYGYPYACRYPAPPAFYSPPSPNYYIRLTFAPDGKLASWKSVAR